MTQSAGRLLAGLVGGSQHAEQELLDRPTLLASRHKIARISTPRCRLDFFRHNSLPLKQTTLSILFRTYRETPPLDKPPERTDRPQVRNVPRPVAHRQAPQRT
jgi:hypothetical protein